MNFLANLALTAAVFFYLVPLQVALRQPIQSGYRGLGTTLALILSTVLVWVCLLATWCVLLTQDGFSWLGGGRPWQFLAMSAIWLALTGVTTLSVGLRSDPEVPMFLRPLMPWAIYVLPALALAVTALLLTIDPIASPQLLTVGRVAFGFCAIVALTSAAGIATEYTIMRQRQTTKERRGLEDREATIRRIVREVEALDPKRDLAQLLLHAGPDRFNEPRNLAAEKILSHPRLNKALAEMLATESSSVVFDYLDMNSPSNIESLAGAVRQAIANTTSRIRQELARKQNLSHDSFFNETDMVLRMADKFSDVSDADYATVIRELRSVFDCPQVKETYVDAVRLLDDWLSNESTRKPKNQSERSVGDQAINVGHQPFLKN